MATTVTPNGLVRRRKAARRRLPVLVVATFVLLVFVVGVIETWPYLAAALIVAVWISDLAATAGAIAATGDRRAGE